MEVSIDAAGGLRLEGGGVVLRGVRPVLNGAVLEGWRGERVEAPAGGLALVYAPPEGGPRRFGLALEPDGSGLALSYWVAGLDREVELDSFGLYFSSIENLRQYLCSGYFSWDGSFYVQPDELEALEPGSLRPETGYALTQLLPRRGEGSLVLGFDRHDRFQHTFTFGAGPGSPDGPPLTILTLWDRKDRAGLERCESERLLVLAHSEVEAALREWAGRVAAASPLPPRRPAPIRGWCSWYNLYASISEENILHHLRSAAEVGRRSRLPMEVFQIDDGFTPEMGDWLEVRPQFPGGMKPVLDEIRAAGYLPGLWIAPFMVGNRSRLYRDHPDWVVRDRLSGGPLALMRFYGEFRWHKRSEEYYILDTTHPAAFDYLRQVFHTWRHDWGCRYFKTDFMHFGSHVGPEQGAWHTPGLTRIEIWRRAAEMIRQEIGPDALWLGCGFPLWAAVGLVDGVRIGRDVGVQWHGDYSAESLLRDQAARNFANGILWQSDPDCILLRERFHSLTDLEVRSLALYAGMAGGVRMTSDDLGELSPDRLRLWKLVLSASGQPCRFPLLGDTELTYEREPGKQPLARAADPVLVQVRAEETGHAAVYIFNTGDIEVQRAYSLGLLGLSSPSYVYDWTKGAAWPGPVESLAVRLAPHDGALLFVGREPFQEEPDGLP